MAETTLADLVKEVKANNKEQTKTTGAIQELTGVFVRQFKLQARGSGDRLEDKIESSRGSGAGATAGQMVPNLTLPGQGMFDGLVVLGTRLASLVGGIATGLAAVVGAFAGLRGWELTAIKNLGKVGDSLKALIPDSLGKNISQAVMNLRASILRRFGINPALPTEFDEATKKKLQIRSPGKLIADTFSKLSQTILSKFGIGEDGKLIALRDAEGKFKSPRFGKLILQVKSFFRPFFALTEGIGNFFKSEFFTKITGFIKGGAKAVARVFQKILWPIGFLFSTWDGVNAYINSDADGFIARLGDGIGGFLGDFVGAPFDLLKKGVSWIMTNWLGFDEGGKVMTLINGFSFEETIGGLVSGLFGLVQDAVDWVGTLFTDPKKALEQLWTTYIGVWNGLGDFIWTKAVKPAVEWVTGLFGWDDTELPTWDGLTGSVISLFNTAKDWVTSKFTWVTENLPTWDGLTGSVISLFNTAKEWISSKFTWVTENLPTWDGLTGSVTGLFESAKDWVTSKFTWVTENLPTWDGFTSTVTGLFKSAKEWISGKFTWAEDTLPTWDGLKSIATDAFYKVKDFIIGDLNNITEFGTSISGIIKAVGDNLGLIKDILKAEITFQIARIVNGFKNAFDQIATFVNNLGDRLYIMISENLRFRLPEVKIPETFLTPEFTLIPPIDVGVGDASTRAAAASRIAERNATRDSNIERRNNQTTEEFMKVQELQNQLNNNIQNVIINNIDNSTTDNSSNNSSSIVSTGNNADTFSLVQ